jgi:hypothetical protein
MTVLTLSAADRARLIARRAQDRYLDHVRHSDCCVGGLCRKGRALEKDADATGEWADLAQERERRVREGRP